MMVHASSIQYLIHKTVFKYPQLKDKQLLNHPLDYRLRHLSKTESLSRGQS
jgi:hypothetical protein